MERDFAFTVEELQFRLSCAINLVDAVHTAMEDGPYDLSEYVDALYGAYAYLSALNAELRGCVKQEFDRMARAKACTQIGIAQKVRTA